MEKFAKYTKMTEILNWKVSLLFTNTNRPMSFQRIFSVVSSLLSKLSFKALIFFSWIQKIQKYKIIFWEIVVKKMGKSVICLSNSFDETDDIYTTPKRKNIPKISGLSSPSGLCRTPGYGVHSRYTQVSPDSGFELTPSPSSHDKEFKPSSIK